MATPQSSILPEALNSAVVVEADVSASKLNKIREACARIRPLLTQFQTVHPNANLCLSVGFGSSIWTKLRKEFDEGAEIKPFRTLGGGLAPATQHDLAFHIQSNSHGLNMMFLSQLVDLFDDSIQIADETHAYRLHEDRGFEGFVDGTENPKGEKRTQFGIIADGEIDAGGSYLLLQKYRHDLKKWAAFDDKAQADMIGRTKQDNIEYAKEERLPDSHLGRVNLKENGVGLKIVRQSLPFGYISGDHGLLFIAYCARLYNIEKQLLSMFGEADGKIDLVLKHLSQAISGSYYFVPSEERLADLNEV